MITPELVSYIKSQQSLGKDATQIKAALMQSGGWRMADIDEAFAATAARPRSSHLKSMIVVLLVLLALGGGAVYAAMKYNIRTVADIQAFLMGASDGQESIQENPVQQPMLAPLNSVGIAEEYIVGDLFAIALSEKIRSIKSIPMTDICVNKEYVDKRALTIRASINNGFPLAETDYYCQSTTSTFVESLPLPNGGYFCIDSQDFFGVVDTVPTTMCGPASTKFTVNQTMVSEMKQSFSEMTTPTAIAAMDAARVRATAEAETSKRISIQSTAAAGYDPDSSYVGTCVDIKKQFPSTTCFDTTSGYAASYILSSGATMCIDANGFADIITKVHTKTVCPK